jgi:hypothetical protein
MNRKWFQLLKALDGGKKMRLYSLKNGADHLELSTKDVQFSDNGVGKRSFAVKKQAGGLCVELDGRVYEKRGAVEWVAWLENCGTEDTQTLSEICAADLYLPAKKDGAVCYSGILGDDCSGDCFLPFEHALTPGAGWTVTPYGGRSSCKAFTMKSICTPILILV